MNHAYIGNSSRVGRHAFVSVAVFICMKRQMDTVHPTGRVLSRLKPLWGSSANLLKDCTEARAPRLANSVHISTATRSVGIDHVFEYCLICSDRNPAQTQ